MASNINFLSFLQRKTSIYVSPIRSTLKEFINSHRSNDKFKIKLHSSRSALKSKGRPYSKVAITSSPENQKLVDPLKISFGNHLWNSSSWGLKFHYPATSLVEIYPRSGPFLSSLTSLYEVHKWIESAGLEHFKIILSPYQGKHPLILKQDIKDYWGGEHNLSLSSFPWIHFLKHERRFLFPDISYFLPHNVVIVRKVSNFINQELFIDKFAHFFSNKHLYKNFYWGGRSSKKISFFLDRLGPLVIWDGIEIGSFKSHTLKDYYKKTKLWDIPQNGIWLFGEITVLDLINFGRLLKKPRFIPEIESVNLWENLIFKDKNNLNSIKLLIREEFKNFYSIFWINYFSTINNTLTSSVKEWLLKPLRNIIFISFLDLQLVNPQWRLLFQSYIDLPIAIYQIIKREDFYNLKIGLGNRFSDEHAYNVFQNSSLKGILSDNLENYQKEFVYYMKGFTQDPRFFVLARKSDQVWFSEFALGSLGREVSWDISKLRETDIILRKKVGFTPSFSVRGRKQNDGSGDNTSEKVPNDQNSQKINEKETISGVFFDKDLGNQGAFSEEPEEAEEAGNKKFTANNSFFWDLPLPSKRKKISKKNFNNHRFFFLNSISWSLGLHEELHCRDPRAHLDLLVDKNYSQLLDEGGKEGKSFEPSKSGKQILMKQNMFSHFNSKKWKRQSKLLNFGRVPLYLLSSLLPVDLEGDKVGNFLVSFEREHFQENIWNNSIYSNIPRSTFKFSGGDEVDLNKISNLAGIKEYLDIVELERFDGPHSSKEDLPGVLQNLLEDKHFNSSIISKFKVQHLPSSVNLEIEMFGTRKNRVDPNLLKMKNGSGFFELWKDHIRLSPSLFYEQGITAKVDIEILDSGWFHIDFFWNIGFKCDSVLFYPIGWLGDLVYFHLPGGGIIPILPSDTGLSHLINSFVPSPFWKFLDLFSRMPTIIDQLSIFSRRESEDKNVITQGLINIKNGFILILRLIFYYILSILTHSQSFYELASSIFDIPLKGNTLVRQTIGIEAAKKRVNFGFRIFYLYIFMIEYLSQEKNLDSVKNTLMNFWKSFRRLDFYSLLKETSSEELGQSSPVTAVFFYLYFIKCGISINVKLKSLGPIGRTFLIFLIGLTGHNPLSDDGSISLLDISNNLSFNQQLFSEEGCRVKYFSWENDLLLEDSLKKVAPAVEFDLLKSFKIKGEEPDKMIKVLRKIIQREKDHITENLSIKNFFNNLGLRGIIPSWFTKK